MSALQPPSSRYCCNTRQISCKVYQNIISLTIRTSNNIFLGIQFIPFIALKESYFVSFFLWQHLERPYEKLTKQTRIKLKWSSFFCVLKKQSDWMKKFVSCGINELNILFFSVWYIHTRRHPLDTKHTVKNDSRFGGAICYLSFSLRHVKWYFMSV